MLCEAIPPGGEPMTPHEEELLTQYHAQYIQQHQPMEDAAKVLPEWHALLLRQRDEGQGSRLHVRQVDETLAFVERTGQHMGVRIPTAPAAPAADPITPPVMPDRSHVVEAPMHDATPQQRAAQQENEYAARQLRERQEQEARQRQQDQQRRR